MMKNLVQRLHRQILDSNIFLKNDFPNNLDAATAKRFGQITTRLYILFLLLSLSTVAVYTIIDPHTLAKTFDKPNFDLYTSLQNKYKGQLRCSCSSIASTYRQYVTAEPSFHKVMKSNSRNSQNRKLCLFSFKDLC